MQLYGRQWTRREVEARVGRLEQIGGLRRIQLNEGLEKGVEQIQVRTGAGLSYFVSPDRCLDIALTTFGDVPLCWQAANGDVHPAYFDATGMEWLRTAAGGLLMTCGLTQVGNPNQDAGEILGLHGRAHHLPARQVTAAGYWEGDEYEMRIGGMVEQAIMYGEHLRLTRSIRSRLGENRIDIHDVVENIGFASTPHMLLYHFNFGFPLLSPETALDFPSQRVLPRPPHPSIEGHARWQDPDPTYEAQVYYHQELESVEGWASARVHNPHFPTATGTTGLSVHLRWQTDTLPRLVQWKMPGAGLHVMGIEPANCYVDGRAAERERGTLLMLEPGQRLTYRLRLEIEATA